LRFCSKIPEIEWTDLIERMEIAEDRGEDMREVDDPAEAPIGEDDLVLPFVTTAFDKLADRSSDGSDRRVGVICAIFRYVPSLPSVMERPMSSSRRLQQEARPRLPSCL
jgi:hypothetical protein